MRKTATDKSPSVPTSNVVSKWHPPGVGSLRRFGRFVGTAGFRILAIGGTVAVVAIGADVAMAALDERKLKNRVLVLPFSRMKFYSEPGAHSWFPQKDGVAVHEFVGLIHEASKDPAIVALFGEFGHGGGFSGGYAEAEEIRNALRVFRESHRVHREPNLTYEKFLTRNGHSTPKPMYAYADQYQYRSGCLDYYLASVFSHVHLREHGELDLPGISSSIPFFSRFLQRNGIKVHVFKHGAYKNAPNAFTEKGFTAEHRENAERYLFSIDNFIRKEIARSRKILDVPYSTWRLIQNSGAFTPQAALRMGFVDYLPSKSPLHPLVLLKSKDKPASGLLTSGGEEEQRAKDDHDALKDSVKQQLGGKTDVKSFLAEEVVSLHQYRNIVRRRKRAEYRQWLLYDCLRALANTSQFVADRMDRILGLSAPYFNFKASDPRFSEEKANSKHEKIAVLYLMDTINYKKVHKLLPLIRKIADDKSTKCIVLRIDSPGGEMHATETLYQELKSVPQNVVVSCGNYCASGGYYVASMADRIFASNTTITGSIGVFTVKLDLLELAEKYGIDVESISTSELALAGSPFSPCTKKVKENLQRSTDLSYERFKDVVVQGRDLEPSTVEALAGGRIWTGEDAKQSGLVDDIGGLQRAIAFARRNYTSSGGTVEVIQESAMETSMVTKLRWSDLQRSSLASVGMISPKQVLDWFCGEVVKTSAGVYLTMDEDVAVRSLFDEQGPSSQ